MSRIIGLAFKECNGEGQYLAGWVMQPDRPFPANTRQRAMLSFNVFVSVRKRIPEAWPDEPMSKYFLRGCHNIHERYGFSLEMGGRPLIVKEKDHE